MKTFVALILAVLFLGVGFMMLIDTPRQFDQDGLYRHTKSSRGKVYYDKVETGAELANEEPTTFPHLSSVASSFARRRFIWRSFSRSA